MVMAIELSKNLGHLSGQDAGRAVEYIRSIGLPTNINSIEGSTSWHPDELIQHMQHDKKVSNGQLRFVLIKGIGEAYLTADVEKKQVYSVIEKSLSGDL